MFHDWRKIEKKEKKKDRRSVRWHRSKLDAKLGQELAGANDSTTSTLQYLIVDFALGNVKMIIVFCETLR